METQKQNVKRPKNNLYEGLKTFVKILIHDLRNRIAGISLNTETSEILISKEIEDLIDYIRNLRIKDVLKPEQIEEKGIDPNQTLFDENHQIIKSLESLRETINESLGNILRLIILTINFLDKSTEDLINKPISQQIETTKRTNLKEYIETKIIPRYETHQLNIQVVSDETITADIDTRLLDTIFENIIGNAIKYNDKAKCEIKISLKEIGDTIFISILDNGPGINKKELKIRNINVIFDEGVRLNHTVGGTGLGLNIVKKFVEMHRGKVNATNTSTGLRIDIEIPKSQTN